MSGEKPRRAHAHRTPPIPESVRQYASVHAIPPPLPVPGRTSLRRRIWIVLIIFIATSVVEFSLVAAAVASATNQQRASEAVANVQKQYLLAEVAFGNEFRIGSGGIPVSSAQVTDVTNLMDEGILRLRATSALSRPALAKDVDTLKTSLDRWRAKYLANEKPGSTEPFQVTPNQPLAEGVTTAWTTLGKDLDQAVDADTASAARARTSVIIVAFLVATIGLALGIASVVLLRRAVLRPVTRLRALAVRMAAGATIDAHEDVSGASELEEVRLAIVAAATKMRMQSAALATASEAKSAFIGHLSHELRTPLNAVLGMAASMQMEAGVTPTMRDGLHTIRDAGEHLLLVINDVLDLARVEAGQVTLTIEEVSVIEIITSAMELAQPLATAAGVRIETEIYSHSTVTCDRRRTVQVILNLLSNAIKYGGTKAPVKIRCTSPREGVWRMSITDHGAGVPAGLQDSLFNAFERGNADGSEIEGTGLGLALSRRLTEAMHGHMGLDSKPSDGSTFWLDLPAGTPRRSPTHATDPPAPPPNGGPPSQTPAAAQPGAIPDDLMDFLRVD